MKLSTFDFNEAPVRAQLDEHGEPWFVAADVCRALGLGNAPQAIASLDADEKMTISNSDGHSGKRGGAQSFILISESGVYALIFRSRKPVAKVFRRWVTKEVLPAIRKTGRYSMEQSSQRIEEPRWSISEYLAVQEDGLCVDMASRMEFGYRLKRFCWAMGVVYSTTVDHQFGEVQSFPEAACYYVARQYEADLRNRFIAERRRA